MPAAGEGLEKLEDMIVRAAETTAQNVRAATAAIGTVIFGQDKVIEQALVTILSGGHALLLGVPGLAKTKLVETMGIVLGLDARRIQFTPDLMPSDILGTEVLEESATGKRSFRFLSGPVFAQLLMADEINRASPRTQSALLQAMQEQHVTVAGTRHDLPKPFHVPRRTRWSRKAPIRCPRRSSTAFSWRSTSAIPIATPSAESCSRLPAPRRRGRRRQ
jgi:MoxR-like ATPase